VAANRFKATAGEAQRRNPKFHGMLKELAALHDRKSHDYAQDADPYSNFRFAASVAAPFSDPLDRVFAVLVGVKLARLAELTSAGKTPNHESLQDTRRDLANYACIWASLHE
jgi:hypothetical protein